MNTDTAIVIVDFNGHVQGTSMIESFWAEWNGRTVVFGGDWQGVPDMPADVEPDSKSVWAWAGKHSTAGE